MKLTNEQIDEFWTEFERVSKSKLANAQGEAVAFRDWTEDFSHENGNYTCVCCKCASHFVGHKRRVICKVCARPPMPDSLPDATVESIMRQVDIVVANTQKLTEAGLNVQFAQGAYKELERQIDAALRAHMGRKL